MEPNEPSPKPLQVPTPKTSPLSNQPVPFAHVMHFELSFIWLETVLHPFHAFPKQRIQVVRIAILVSVECRNTQHVCVHVRW